jgi:hypothetical protein
VTPTYLLELLVSRIPTGRAPGSKAVGTAPWVRSCGPAPLMMSNSARTQTHTHTHTHTHTQREVSRMQFQCSGSRCWQLQAAAPAVCYLSTGSCAQRAALTKVFEQLGCTLAGELAVEDDCGAAATCATPAGSRYTGPMPPLECSQVLQLPYSNISWLRSFRPSGDPLRAAIGRTARAGSTHREPSPLDWGRNAAQAAAVSRSCTCSLHACHVHRVARLR